MKKILVCLALIAVCSIPLFAAFPVNNLYTATVSTVPVTQGNSVPDIAYSPCNIKWVDVTNPTATPQVITVYSSALSSSTRVSTLKYTFSVPASSGTISMPIFEGVPTVWSSLADSINIPYITFKTDAAVGFEAKIAVKFWK